VTRRAQSAEAPRVLGVAGAGTMGSGIAMVFANAGVPVMLKDSDQAALERGLSNIQKNYANSAKRGRFTPDFVEQRLKLIQPALSYDPLASVDMVVEAVFENMALKKEIFAELNRVCKPGAILATNTSSLNIDEIASATSRPQSVIGTHFFSPANVMRLLEIVRERQSTIIFVNNRRIAERLAGNLETHVECVPRPRHWGGSFELRHRRKCCCSIPALTARE